MVSLPEGLPARVWSPGRRGKVCRKMSTILILDNGGATIKAGVAGEDAPRVTMPNAVARIKRQTRLLVGDEIARKIKDASHLQFMRPTESGVITDTFIQSLIWERLLGKEHLGFTGLQDTGLVLSIPALTPSASLEGIYTMAFDTFKFGAVACVPAPQLTAAALAAEVNELYRDPSSLPTLAKTGTGVIIDFGFSCTSIVPLINWEPIPSAIRRVDIGGKALTNYLKEIVSFRQWNMMDDTGLVNDVKERLCFVSPRSARPGGPDMEAARRLSASGVMNRIIKQAGEAGCWGKTGPTKEEVGDNSLPVDDGIGIGFRREYVLPDHASITSGYVRGGGGG